MDYVHPGIECPIVLNCLQPKVTGEPESEMWGHRQLIILSEPQIEGSISVIRYNMLQPQEAHWQFVDDDKYIGEYSMRNGRVVLKTPLLLQVQFAFSAQANPSDELLGKIGAQVRINNTTYIGDWWYEQRIHRVWFESWYTEGESTSRYLACSEKHHPIAFDEIYLTVNTPYER